MFNSLTVAPPHFAANSSNRVLHLAKFEKYPICTNSKFQDEDLMNCIDLAKPRTVTITAAAHRYDYVLQPISERDWFRYFDAIVSSAERKGDQVVEEFDTSRARLLLIEAALESVSGYELAGAADLSTIPNWREKLPFKHRLAVAAQLVNVQARDPEDEVVSLGAETVMLTAVWGANDQGVLQQYTNLKHVFETPTADHYRRYQREMSRSYIVGGSRGGKTVWKGAQKELARIYDELIVSVEGYTFNDVPVEGRDQAAKVMDTYHKVAAALHLFRAADVSAGSEEEK
jgi:hypothetical protein